ncbi:cytoplasmic protein [Rhodopirellula baltica]|nr:cytoplasmic protein [Rhodopirellula baltica]
MPDSTPDLITAHKHSSNHRDEIVRSDTCGCFYCMAVFQASEITEWIDEVDGVDTTAMCPSCGIDSVIGSAAGYPITADFLRAMHGHWF